VEVGQQYLIGAETSINIVKIKSEETEAYWGPQKQLSEKFTTNNDFLSFLALEQSSDVQLHGLSEWEQEIINSQMIRLDETFQSNPCFSRPFIKLEIANSSNLNTKPLHMLIDSSEAGSETPPREFSIGRSGDCDIIITQSTISRH